MNTLSARERTEESSYAGRFRKTSSRRLEKKIIYPDRDGKPMSDNTEQFEWIVKIKENLEQMFDGNPDVFVAGDLLWYPVEGNNRIRTAPDTMVAFGRPKGYRGSYRQWEENHIAPQVVFEILSPGNRAGEMKKKFVFYDTYAVSEYYVYDPDRILLSGWIRRNNVLTPVENMQGWISPLLKIRFELTDNDLYIFRPDGNRFLSPVELRRLFQSERIRADRLAAKLRELGIEAD
ncbi:MAG TPA: hypothetical protein DCQ37_01670 [Desulfobacteraceae bacterium]|nr:hypothetical protein [Desulfobacteraceae bacterium]